MAIIRFTRLVRPPRIIHRHADLSFGTKKEFMFMEGVKVIDPSRWGDPEFEVMAEAVLSCWQDHVETQKGKIGPDVPFGAIRGAGIHPKAGPFIAYKRDGRPRENFVVKITEKETYLRGYLRIYSEQEARGLAQLLRDMIGDRAEIRAAITASRKKEEAA